MGVFNPDTTTWDVETYPTTGYGADITTSASADTYVGTYVELVPASTITTDCYIIGLSIRTSDPTSSYRVKLGKGTASSEVDFLNVTADNPNGYTIIFPIARKKLEANTRLAFDAMDDEAASNTISVAVILEVQP